MAGKRKKGMTLAEHDALLKASGQQEAMIERARQQEEEREKRADEWRKAEAPLVTELRAAGFQVDSAWDLVNIAEPYHAALPILLEHLSRPYPGAVREGIARALAVRDAKFGWEKMRRLYSGEQDKRAKDGLAVALAAMADDAVLDEVISLARDVRHGSSRLLLLAALERSTDARARAALMELGTDPELREEVQVALRRLRLKGS